MVMHLQDTGARMKFLIRDQDIRYPATFDAVLQAEDIETVQTGVRMPRMNAIMERWVRSCRTELLDRTLVWNQAHLLHALREYEAFYNEHRVRHEALYDRMEVKDLCRQAVAAAGQKLGAA
jgi:transposase InsO family protein